MHHKQYRWHKSNISQITDNCEGEYVYMYSTLCLINKYFLILWNDMVNE